LDQDYANAFAAGVTMVHFAMTLGDDVGTVEGDATSEFTMRVGPISEDLLDQVTVALRLFTDVGMFYQAEFGVSDGSGLVSGLKSVLDE
jgi:hypothetical protein